MVRIYFESGRKLNYRQENIGLIIMVSAVKFRI